MKKVQRQFKKGDVVICLKFGRNNSDMIAGNKYAVSKVDDNGMIKLEGHPDWWSPERFKKLNSDKAVQECDARNSSSSNSDGYIK